jgi:RHS repeat-associated protein
VVISDVKNLEQEDLGTYDDNGILTSTALDGILEEYFTPTVKSFSDAYPFGMTIKNRSWFDADGDYRYGFNGMEKNLDINSEGNDYTTTFRQYDARIARWKSLDPLSNTFPWQSPYASFDNNPIRYNDPVGLAASETIYENGEGDQVEVEDGVDALVRVNDTDFEEAKFFAAELNTPKDPSLKATAIIDYNVVEAYRGFYETHRSYGGVSIASIWDYLTVEPFKGMTNPAEPQYGLGPAEWLGGGPIGKGAMTATQRSLKLFKFQKHHIIPKAIFKKYKPILAALMKRDGAYNLKTLPTPFHGNHPQYNTYVGDQIKKLIKDGDVTSESIRGLQKELRFMLKDAYDSGKKINDYFRPFNP